MPLNLLTCFNLVTSSAAVHGRVTGGINGALASRNRKRIGPNWTRFKRQYPIEFERRRFASGRSCGEFEQRRSLTFPQIDLPLCRCLWSVGAEPSGNLVSDAVCARNCVTDKTHFLTILHCEHSTCMHLLCLAESLTRKNKIGLLRAKAFKPSSVFRLLHAKLCLSVFRLSTILHAMFGWLITKAKQSMHQMKQVQMYYMDAEHYNEPG